MIQITHKNKIPTLTHLNINIYNTFLSSVWQQSRSPLALTYSRRSKSALSESAQVLTEIMLFVKQTSNLGSFFKNKTQLS